MIYTWRYDHQRIVKIKTFIELKKITVFPSIIITNCYVLVDLIFSRRMLYLHKLYKSVMRHWCFNLLLLQSCMSENKYDNVVNVITPWLPCKRDVTWSYIKSMTMTEKTVLIETNPLSFTSQHNNNFLEKNTGSNRYGHTWDASCFKYLGKYFKILEINNLASISRKIYM